MSADQLINVFTYESLDESDLKHILPQIDYFSYNNSRLRTIIRKCHQPDFHGQHYIRYGSHWSLHLEAPLPKLVRYYMQNGRHLKARSQVLRAALSFYTTLFTAQRAGTIVDLGKPAYVGQVVYNSFF